MAWATADDVLKYVAECAESIMEDDLNEAEEWTGEEFEDLLERAWKVTSLMKDSKELAKRVEGN